MIKFWGEHDQPNGYMSNFYPSTFIVPQIPGVLWPTNEHFFAAMKTTDKRLWPKFADCSTPLKAKKMGRSVKLRPDWEQIKISVMVTGLLCKFLQNERLLAQLVDTYPKVLHEDSPYDQIWGSRNGGLDLLGKCLVQVREHLRVHKCKATEAQVAEMAKRVEKK